MNYFTQLLSLLILINIPASFIAQEYSFANIVKDGVGDVDGIDGNYGLVVSPDDKFVYTASTSDDAVSVFSVGEDGELTHVESHFDAMVAGGTVTGL